MKEAIDAGPQAAKVPGPLRPLHVLQLQTTDHPEGESVNSAGVDFARVAGVVARSFSDLRGSLFISPFRRRVRCTETFAMILAQHLLREECNNATHASQIFSGEQEM